MVDECLRVWVDEIVTVTTRLVRGGVENVFTMRKVYEEVLKRIYVGMMGGGKEEFLVRELEVARESVKELGSVVEEFKEERVKLLIEQDRLRSAVRFRCERQNAEREYDLKKLLALQSQLPQGGAIQQLHPPTAHYLTHTTATQVDEAHLAISTDIQLHEYKSRIHVLQRDLSSLRVEHDHALRTHEDDASKILMFKTALAETKREIATDIQLRAGVLKKSRKPHRSKWPIKVPSVPLQGKQPRRFPTNDSPRERRSPKNMVVSPRGGSSPRHQKRQPVMSPRSDKPSHKNMMTSPRGKRSPRQPEMKSPSSDKSSPKNTPVSLNDSSRCSNVSPRSRVYPRTRPRDLNIFQPEPVAGLGMSGSGPGSLNDSSGCSNASMAIDNKKLVKEFLARKATSTGARKEKTFAQRIRENKGKLLSQNVQLHKAVQCAASSTRGVVSDAAMMTDPVEKEKEAVRLFLEEKSVMLRVGVVKSGVEVATQWEDEIVVVNEVEKELWKLKEEEMVKEAGEREERWENVKNEIRRRKHSEMRDPPDYTYYEGGVGSPVSQGRPRSALSKRDEIEMHEEWEIVVFDHEARLNTARVADAATMYFSRKTPSPPMPSTRPHSGGPPTTAPTPSPPPAPSRKPRMALGGGWYEPPKDPPPHHHQRTTTKDYITIHVPLQNTDAADAEVRAVNNVVSSMK